MSLIRVQCETCQATLRVRDEGFVGEVHACPRCGSMVLIGGGTAADASGAEASADTPPKTLVLGDTLETLAEPAPPAETTPAETTLSEAASSESTSSEAHAPGSTPVEAASEASADLMGAPEPVAGWAPIVTTVVSLMATGAILTVWWVSGSPETSRPTEAVKPPETLAQATPEVEAPKVETAGTAKLTAEASDPEEPAAFGEQPFEATEPAIVPSPPPEPEPRLARVDPPPEPLVPTPTPHAAPIEELAGEIDPLAFDPAEAVVILRRGVEAPPVSATPPIEPVPDEPEVEAPPTLDERLAATARQAGVFVRLGPTDGESVPFAGSADAALTQVVPSAELRDIPLDDAVRLLGRLAGVPITLDPRALRYAGVAVTRPVDVLGEGRSVEELLADALKPARLVYESDGPHLAVVRPGIARDREVTHRLSDLAKGEPGALVEDLRQLVPFETSYELTPDASLRLTAPMAVHYDLRIVSERLRLARGLPRETKYPLSLLPSDASLGSLEPILGRRATFSFVEPTPLEDLFDYWRRATRLTILVDWRSLADAGLGPRSRLACSVTNRTWRDGLDGVLGSLGLGWTALEGKTLWISTTEVLAERPTVEFYAVPAADAGAIRARLLDRRRNAAVVYDPASGRLLVRGGPATHRDAHTAAKR